MISISHKMYENLPFLEIVEESKIDDPLPLIIFYHGWLGRKENVLTQGYEIAKRGFRVVLPEALFHGERADGPTKDHQLQFWQIIEKSIEEFPKFVKLYAQQDLILDNKVAVSGLSMGGITTCAIFTVYPWIKCAVCLEGTPNPVAFAKLLIDNLPGIENIPEDFIHEQLAGLNEIDLSLNPEKIAGRPLHFWHGTDDKMVPYDLTKKFYDEVSGKPYAKNVTMTTTEGAGHKVSFDTTVEMADKFVEYFTD
ncbi:alpha/beta fold hydrolase [Ligilactobacillus cholophilus]|uniref:alpha/beta fold hydrolase n=1 Tax=Ligilactobacillus cholophilus TaxID=3050131 RepID=UPI0025B07436|nr:alpha/beta fold hydrolase [Ligilactobacillus cholophilus]